MGGGGPSIRPPCSGPSLVGATSGKGWAFALRAPPLSASELAARCVAFSKPEEFIDCAFSFSSPLGSTIAPLPDHVLKAIRLRAALGPRTPSWRSSQLASLKRIVSAIPPPPQGPHLQALSVLLAKAGSRDLTLWEDSCRGTSLVGTVPPSGRWEPLPAQPQGVDSGLSALLAAHAAERARGCWRLPSNRRQEMLRILREETAAPKSFWREVSAKEADGLLKQWCGWLYFPVDEGSKVRGCMDPRELNELTLLSEKCWIPGIDGVVALLGELYKSLGPVRLRFCREDWAHGFRQLALCDTDRRFLCALAWDAQASPGEELRVFIPEVLMFGPRGGPNQFCRVSSGLLEVANSYLAVCAVVNVDDTIIADSEDQVEAARGAFVELAELLRCRQKDAKSFPPRGAGGASAGVCLGVHLQFPEDPAGVDAGTLCTLSLPRDKATKYESALRTILASGFLAPGAAAKLLGRFEWASSTCFGRSARAFLWPFRDHQRLQGPSLGRLTSATVAAGWGLLGFVRNCKGLVLRPPGLPRPTVAGFVDASSAQRSSCLGGCLVAAAGGAFFLKEVDGKLRNWLPPGASVTINESESLAALVWLETFGRGLQGCDAILFLDSESAEGSLLSGYSASPFLTALAGAFWALAAHLQARVWVGRVPSKLNPSDGLSRRDRLWALEQGWAEHSARCPDPGPWRFLVEGMSKPAGSRWRMDKRRTRNQGQ